MATGFQFRKSRQSIRKKIEETSEEEDDDDEEENSTKPSFPSHPSEVFSSNSPSKYPAAYLNSNIDFSDCKPGQGVKCSIVGIYQCGSNGCGMGFKALKIE